MPARSKVERLPEDVREELNRRLIDSGFSNYEEHSAWLAERGYEIKKSSVHRYGGTFEERINSLKLVTEQARAIVSETPDDDNAVNDSLIRLCQEKAFMLLRDLEIDPDTVDLPKLMRAIADMGRASVQQKKWAAEARKLALDEAAKTVEKVAKAEGLSDETIDLFRKKILGIKADADSGAA